MMNVSEIASIEADDDVDHGRDHMRICTPTTTHFKSYCLGPAVHTTLGIAATLVCLFIVLRSGKNGVASHLYS